MSQLILVDRFFFYFKTAEFVSRVAESVTCYVSRQLTWRHNGRRDSSPGSTVSSQLQGTFAGENEYKIR